MTLNPSFQQECEELGQHFRRQRHQALIRRGPFLEGHTERSLSAYSGWPRA